MAAHQLNVAELRALLQAALERQGESIEPSGYAYVSVSDRAEDSLAVESQDPLAESQTTTASETKCTTPEIKCTTAPPDSLKVGTDPTATSSAGDESIRQILQAPVDFSGYVGDKCQDTPVMESQDPLGNLPAVKFTNDSNRPIVIVAQKSLAVTDDHSVSAAIPTANLQVAHTPASNTSVDTPVVAGTKVDSFPVFPSTSNGPLVDNHEPKQTKKVELTFVDQQNAHAPKEFSLLIDQIDTQDLLDGEIEELKRPETHPKEDGEGKEPAIDWKAKYYHLKERFEHQTGQLKRLKKKYDNLDKEKQSTDDYAIRVGKELQDLKDQRNIPQVRFTEEEGIAMTTHEIEELNDRATSDSMFVGLLATHLIGSDNLRNMSVTGQASHRFANLKNPDGSPVYPALDRIDPQIFEFICNKVAERVAQQVGPRRIKTIRKQSESRTIKKYLALKISNLKKSGVARAGRVTVPNITDENRDGNVQM